MNDADDKRTPRIAPSGAVEHFVNSRFQNKLAYIIHDATASLEKWDRDEVIDRVSQFIASRNGKPASPFMNRMNRLRQRSP